ncbi:MAG: hypothetical protein M1812_003467 [Candelaria pacifica]|nr:MAG: hypothetical protein M1812_003467 [Candelaria pacifica]
MNTSAYLQSQGWLGTGHSLPTSSGTPGLAKPLLVSQKRNLYGVGKKSHVFADQWWKKAFDEGLKGLDVGREVRSVGDEGVGNGEGEVVNVEGVGEKVEVGNGNRALEMLRCGGARWVGVNEGGLYGRFVKGEGMKGTIGEGTRKRKREHGDKSAEKEKDGKRIKKDKAVAGVRLPSVAVEDQAVAQDSAESAKELRRRLKRDRKMEKARLAPVSDSERAPEKLDQAKAERRKQRRAKRALRAQDGTPKIASGPTSLNSTPPNDVHQDVTPVIRMSEDTILERKKRKAAKKALTASNLDLGCTALHVETRKKERHRKDKIRTSKP